MKVAPLWGRGLRERKQSWVRAAEQQGACTAPLGPLDPLSLLADLSRKQVFKIPWIKKKKEKKKKYFLQVSNLQETSHLEHDSNQSPPCPETQAVRKTEVVAPLA